MDPNWTKLSTLTPPLEFWDTQRVRESNIIWGRPHQLNPEPSPPVEFWDTDRQTDRQFIWGRS